MMKKVFIVSLIAALVVSCVKNKDIYEGPYVEPGVIEPANEFDYSTSQSVDLTIDYSAYHTASPVFFSIYSEDPFEGTGESMSLKEGITPIFEAYTNAEGKFHDTVTLPAYAKNLYVFTGNFFIAETVINAQLANGAALAVAEGDGGPAPVARRQSAARAMSEATNSLEHLYMLSYEVDVKTGDKTDTQIYKDWVTPLGTWNEGSGHPNYLLDKATANPELVFTEEELNGLYETISNALVANQTCSEEYRMQADLTVERESDISVAFLGSMTCWNNALGYYYYNESAKPTGPHDLNIIMLFPNTQDGKWWRTWCRHPNFYGNIALERGDMVQLMYYPNIASGDLSGATTKFPKGTRIGFILKSNGWGMQKTRDGKKFFNSYNGFNTEQPLARQYNVWATSTDGMSYCNTTGLDKNDCKIQNPQGDSRTAKFAYRSAEGKEYALVGFEDACNDLDYDDIVLALKPADAFTPLPVVEDKKSTSKGVYAFEDLWPSKGDYDMNDALVEVTHEKTYSAKSSTDYKIYQETFYLTTYQNYVTLKTGLALTLDAKETPSSIKMKKIDPETQEETTTVFGGEDNTYLLTEDIKAELGTTYILEVNYANGISQLSRAAEIHPFIYRNEGDDRRWEVHIPYEAPTESMEFGYFGSGDDRSVPEEGKFFVRSGNYPFAFYLDGITIASFKDTLLKKENERVKISDLYPLFLPWVTSNGSESADWYLHPGR